MLRKHSKNERQYGTFEVVKIVRWARKVSIGAGASGLRSCRSL